MKHIALLLAALLVFSLTGCSSSEAAGTASDTDKAGPMRSSRRRTAGAT